MTVAEQKAGLISATARAEIDKWLAKYPDDRKQSAVIAALTAVQHENNGSLTNELMDAVADYLDMAPIAVYEVATFYSMFDLEPVGRHKISVCNNISCMDVSMRNYPKILLLVIQCVTSKDEFFNAGLIDASSCNESLS